MRCSSKQGIAAVFIATVAAACLLGAAPDDKSTAGMGIGRYQIAGSNSSNGVWLVDTATGHVWFRKQGMTWQDEGTPAPQKYHGDPPANSRMDF